MNKVEQATLVLTKTRHIANLLQAGNVNLAAALLVQLHKAHTPLYDRVVFNVRAYVHSDDMNDVEDLVRVILE